MVYDRTESSSAGAFSSPPGSLQAEAPAVSSGLRPASWSTNLRKIWQHSSQADLGMLSLCSLSMLPALFTVCWFTVCKDLV